MATKKARTENSMTYRYLLASLFALVSVAANAQTIVADVTLPDAYRDASIQVVEADGNPDGAHSVGRPTCVGPWLYPSLGSGMTWLSQVAVIQIKGRHYWLIKAPGSARVVVRQMDPPACK